ncbi:Nitric oxide reductase [Porphyromonas levii]|uniref:FprA family A-type flavoprotein n=1 Tax=Porphyromonas levii TaxID=28114 RepID=UPI001B8BF815|nr:FprA family A-type flavoprotein [Porphyromonas levii]MBR8732136.1 Nitric oxide reductase [Porphyromonas levii]MBR8774303.1 Nitric oxide reductase [Porphyromonas levii]
MKYNLKINESTYFFGQNDRTKAFFEHLYPLPHGMAYNNYLIKDEKNVLLDTVDVDMSERFFGQLESALDGEQLDYLIVQHMEPDHSGSIGLVKMRYPNVVIVGNKKTKGMLEGYGVSTEDFLEVDEKTPLNIGSRELHFVFAPMVHWPEVMVTYDPKEKVLFSADAFGAFGAIDGGFWDYQHDLAAFMPEAHRYYTCIVGKYGSFVQKTLDRALQLDIEVIAPVHGVVWKKHIPEILELYRKMATYEAEPGVVMIYGSMYGNTDELAEVIGRSLGAHGVDRVVMHHMGHSSASQVISDVFRYKAVIVGSPTYNNGMWPRVEDVLHQLSERQIPDRLYATFGSGTWNPNTIKPLETWCEKQKNWTKVAESLKISQAPSAEDKDKAWEMGRIIAQAVLNN